MKASSFARITLLAGAMALAAPVFAADATMHEVYVAAEAGKFAEAQTMMDQILRDHPKSGTAHYVEAELLAKQGKFAAAQAELSMAEKLSPGLPKVDAGAVAKLRTLLAAGLAPPKANYSQQPVPRNNNAGYASGGYNNAGNGGGGMPWGTILILGLGLVGFIVLASRFMARRQAATQAYSPAGYSPAGGAPGYAPGAAYPQPGYGPGPVQGGGMMGGGMGSSIVGGLATGAAVGAGIVAGEALMHHFTDGNRDQGSRDQPRNDIVYDQPNNDDLLRRDDMGGNNFGVNDSSSWDDSSGGGGDAGGGGGSDWD